ncbi:MAG: hypothetical protein ABSG98_07775 [Anaerolineales bacterium]|jgi:hypothetical protein
MGTVPVAERGLVGRVLRSDVAGFTLGCRVLGAEIPEFGGFVRVQAQAEVTAPSPKVLGTIADIRFEEDLFVRQLVSADVREEYIEDQRQKRVLPIEVRVIHVGYLDAQGRGHHRLPSQPPLSLQAIQPCEPPELRGFLAGGARGWQMGFVQLLLDAQVPDEALVASLDHALAALDERDQTEFRREAFRELSRLLSQDLRRLDSLLRRFAR